MDDLEGDVHFTAIDTCAASLCHGDGWGTSCLRYTHVDVDNYFVHCTEKLEYEQELCEQLLRYVGASMRDFRALRDVWYSVGRYIKFNTLQIGINGFVRVTWNIDC